MKNSKNDFGIAGQSTTEDKKPHKHDVNLQKNSTLYFQIGLILCLLGTYSLFEMQFQDKKIVIDTVSDTDFAVIDVVPTYTIEEVQKEKPKPIIRATVLTTEFEEVENDKDIVESDIITPDQSEPDITPSIIGDLPDDSDPKDIDIYVPFAKIEVVPVYPGCERKKTNADRKKCMSEKITKLINRKFNTDIGSEYGISGKQRIFTQFTIDKNGNITDVKIRGPHSALEKEAKRVINKIPKMTPGMQRKVPVGVVYTLPIVYDAREY